MTSLEQIALCMQTQEEERMDPEMDNFAMDAS